VGSNPFAWGAYGDVYQGTLDGSRVCIKRMRVYNRDGPDRAAKVRYYHCHLPCPPSPTKPADLLPGGCNVETPDTHEHRTPTGGHHRSLPTCFGFGVWRGPTELHEDEPQCRSASTCRCPRFCVSLAYSRRKLSDVAEGLCYLHVRNIVHGSLKGVRDFLNLVSLLY